MKVRIKTKDIVGIVILLFILLISSILLNGLQSGTPVNLPESIQAASQTDSSKSVYFQNTQDLNEDIQNTLVQYYQTFFNSLANLDSQNLGQFFYQGNPESSTSAYFDQKFQDTVITVRNSQPIDLRFNSYDIGLNVTEVSYLSDSHVELSLEENQSIIFNNIIDQPSLSRVKNRFVLGYLDNRWQILEHDREEDLFVSMSEELDSRMYPGVATTDLIDQINQNRIDNSLEEINTQKQSRIELRDIIDLSPTDPIYNREQAIEYANQFALTRNPEYPFFDDTGGNCNNFISQCLYAGGISMDYSGNNRWFYDGESTDSWINVDYFYDYAKNNTGSGLSGTVDDNLYSGNIGDIIQYGEDDNFKHSVIISGLVKNREGETIDYLIDSNTTDRMNYPASAYGYTEFRLIKVKAN